MSPAMLLDPRVALLAGVGVAIASPRVRRLIGQGLGYGAAGLERAGGAIVHTAGDIYGSARATATPRPSG